MALAYGLCFDSVDFAGNSLRGICRTIAYYIPL